MDGSAGGDTGARDRADMAGVANAVLGDGSTERLVGVTRRGPHSNEVFEVRFDDGRTLMVKRARQAWGRQRFEAAEVAAAMLRDLEGGIRVPEPLHQAAAVGGPAIQAYWRIGHPTLASVWPGLSARGRRRLLRSWGRLLARVHRLPLPSWGRLGTAGAPPPSLRWVLEEDIRERLLPALWGVWPCAAPPLERLQDVVPEVARRVGGRGPTLAHGDLHMGNALCRMDGREPRCVGLLDLDDAAAAPPESDVARLEVLHGPLFDQHVSPRWRAEVWRGYGQALQPRVVAFYRALHLANLGLHSALVGHDEHAGRVARALKDEVARLERGSRLPRGRYSDAARDDRPIQATRAVPGPGRYPGVVARG